MSMKHPYKHFFIPIVAGLATLLVVGLLVGCRTVKVISWDPQMALEHDWSPAVALENGITNSCVETGSLVTGRAHYCRVVEGYEENGDRRNWQIDIVDPYSYSDSPIAVDVLDTRRFDSYSTQTRYFGCDFDNWQRGDLTYGCAIAFQEGNNPVEFYEGCVADNGSRRWYCDYKIRKQVILNTTRSGSWAWDYVLGVAWHWSTGYITTAAACAGGLTSLTRGAALTHGLLVACADGPM